MIHSYKELTVWQKAMDLVIEVYKLTKLFPKEEVYSLVSQMRRAAVAIPSNIAEGRGRSTRKDFRQFITIAYSSGAELETQIEIAKRLQLTELRAFQLSDQLLEEVMKMLNSMLSKLQS